MGIWLKWARRHHTVGESQCYCVLDMARTQGIVSDQILGIGVGVLGPVDFAWEVLVAPPLMPEWENFSSRNIFKKTFQSAYVVIKNDVNILALGDIGGACVSLLGVMFFGLLLNAFIIFYIDSYI
jgi:predicted NBD/HSP70 family sugar kinase